MTITGTITTAFPESSGTSRSGKAWRRREYIVTYDTTNVNYPKSIVFSVMNERIDSLNLQQGNTYDLDIDFEAREWNGRYFLQASCWRAVARQQVQTAPAAVPAPAVAPAPVAQDGADGLPF